MEKRNRFALKLQVPTDEDKHIILNNFQNTTGSTIQDCAPLKTNDNKLTQLTESLYISDFHSAQDHNLLKEERITHIVSLVQHKLNLQTLETPKPEIVVLSLSMRDQNDQDIVFFIYETLYFIESALKANQCARILVHCFKGQSRSVIVTAGYLIWKNKWSADYALDHISKRTGKIDPNLSFYQQIKDFSSRQMQNKKINITCKQNMFTKNLHPFQKQANISQQSRVFIYTFDKERIVSKYLPLTAKKEQQKYEQQNKLNCEQVDQEYQQDIYSFQNITQSKSEMDKYLGSKQICSLFQFGYSMILFIAKIPTSEYLNSTKCGVLSLLRLASYIIQLENIDVPLFIYYEESGKLNKVAKLQTDKAWSPMNYFI